MNTITIPTKEYRELKEARERLGELLNVKIKKHLSRALRESFTDLVGALNDVKELKGKTSVEAQHMIRDIWHEKRSS